MCSQRAGIAELFAVPGPPTVSAPNKHNKSSIRVDRRSSQRPVRDLALGYPDRIRPFLNDSVNDWVDS